MNPLLAEIASAERDQVLADTPAHTRALRLLEWERVTALVARRCFSAPAAARIAARRPFVDPSAIALHQALSTELRPEAEREIWPPLCDVTDAVALLACEPPFRLDGGELRYLAAAAGDLDILRGYFLAREEACPRWWGGAGRMERLDGLRTAVERTIDRDGSVRDDATPELSRLRREAAAGERHVRSEVARAVSAAHARGILTGQEATLRGQRFCLPVRAGSKNRVEGIVHDRSASGGTLYIEPSSVVRMQNDLTELRLAAVAEEQRILLELNGVVEAHAERLGEACEFGLRVDETCAALRWSFAVKGTRVMPEPGGRIDLRDARHPLLEAQSEREDLEVVPLDLPMPEGARILVISGPNAGGKTVALKCMGLMTLLAQCGWDLPAREDTALPLMTRIFVDLGDDQSITRSLSSFSAHLGHLSGFLREADATTLILCDEIGSGTDPEEGTALAYTVLEGLAERGATVLASTHYSLLKAAVDDHPAMANAAMDFDERSLAPLFTLRVGVPGASHAFDIAARMDFPADLLDRARERVGEERFRVERLLVELGQRARGLQEAQTAARGEAEAARRDREEAARRLSGVDEERRALLGAAQREGERFLAEARSTLEKVVREIRAAGADGKAIRYGRDAVARLREKLPTAGGSGGSGRSGGEDKARELVPGRRVRVPHLGLIGRVTEIRGDKVVVDADGLRLTMTSDHIEPTTDTPGNDDARSVERAGSWNWDAGAPAAHEIDLRGSRADEGWDALDRLIDRAIPAGVIEISVIHGFGTGRLRSYLHERLDCDSRVASFRDAPADQGGEGRTLVTLSA